MISVIVPTIDGRGGLLARCVQSYHDTLRSYREAGGSYEVIVIPGREKCGIAWQEGAEKARGDYLHFTADDIEAQPGWWQGAISVANPSHPRGRGIPAPLILNPDGSVQSCGGSWERVEPDGAITEFTRVPFLSRIQFELVAPIPPIHYYTDNWVSYWAGQHGYPTIVSHRYQLVHHMSEIGRRVEGGEHDEYVRYRQERHDQH